MRARTLALAAVTMCSVSGTAVGGSTTARIEHLLLYDGGNLIYVYPVGGVQNPPGCHGSNGNYYSFSMSRSMAKEYLAGLLAAQARGAIVTIWGTGTCMDQSVSETLMYFSIKE